MEHDASTRHALRRLVPRVLAVAFAVTAGGALILREQLRARPAPAAEPAALDGGAAPAGGVDALGTASAVHLPVEADATYLPTSKSLSLDEVVLSAPPTAGEPRYLFSSKSAPIPLLEPPAEAPAPDEAAGGAEAPRTDP